jgi:redox-sensitive bicupin YhaK (pirin superfamily)
LIGGAAVYNFTPFLLFNKFYINLNAGFPDHPHCGVETITYVLKSYINYEDLMGSKSTLQPGDLQFMTAKRGVVHARMLYINKNKYKELQAVESSHL